MPQIMSRLTLRAGALEAQIAAQAGGSIARFDRLEGEQRLPLLRGNDGADGDALDAACFPLVPYANRIRDGRFVCDGRSVHLAPNSASDPNPLHGQGWRGAWQVASAGVDAAELVFEHPAGEWPWRYEARQRIEIDDGGLNVRLSCRNLSAEPMPCGLGLHPYFPCAADTELDAAVSAVWTVDERVLPVERVAAAGRYDLRRRRICGQGLDTGFEGWDGRALIRWPGRGLALRLSSPDAVRFQVWSPAAGGVFVAEPVHNANAALNRPQAEWADAGLRLLARGDEAVLQARFEVFRDDGARRASGVPAAAI